ARIIGGTTDETMMPFISFRCSPLKSKAISQAFQFHLLSYADRCESANYILIYHPKIRRASYSYYLYPARKSFVQRSLFFNITSLLYHNVSIFIDVNLF